MNETVLYLIKFVLMFFALLAIIFIITILTPKLAKIIDSRLQKKKKSNPERVNDDLYEVKGIYDAQYPQNKNEENTDNNTKNISNGESENGKE